MHQPWYRESLDGDFRLPWVYLHALKDYSDMAAHLEAHPNMRTVVNFTPVLLEQLEQYANDLHEYLSTGKRLADPLLNLLLGIDALPDDIDEKMQLVSDCQRAFAPRMIEPYSDYTQLLSMVKNKKGKVDVDLLSYMQDQYFYDLLVWYHIAWTGHDLKQTDTIRELIAQGKHFTDQQRRQLAELIADAIKLIPERYKALVESGQIELSMTPYSHPIVPLLLDFNSMDCALPDAPKPSYTEYPGGKERSLWHMQHGIDVFKRFFGFAPKGVWLSEGAVSEAAVQLLPQFDIQWTASGEGVWHNSSHLSELTHDDEASRKRLFKPHRLPDTDTRLFFRDDGLSDMIGFNYQDWKAEDAAANFVQHMKNIATYLGEDADQHVVPVILDGENAWEYYPDNAYHFLGSFYEQVSQCEHIEVTTFTDVVASVQPVELPKLCAGSWVYGSFSTWIGEPDKNRGWDRLVEAKQTYDRVMQEPGLTEEEKHQAGLQLAVCEGSDWFWWFGDYNPSDSVKDFDELYRQQLSGLYQLLKQPVPDNLSESLSSGGGNAENSGTMRRVSG